MVIFLSLLFILNALMHGGVFFKHEKSLKKGLYGGSKMASLLMSGSIGGCLIRIIARSSPQGLILQFRRYVICFSLIQEFGTRVVLRVVCFRGRLTW